jgi:beta-1,4-mannosyl-glycoprotein beta-1,4-N-acetylglucosaminyltransferase
MKIIDTFLFYNEEKLLDYRLNYYKGIVDYFIVVEATKTFSGMDKPLYFDNIKHKYSHFNNIIHVIVDNMPSSITITFDNSIIAPSSNWEREFYQRNYIKKALQSIPDISHEDWIMINDVDEFPNRDKLIYSPT